MARSSASFLAQWGDTDSDSDSDPNSNVENLANLLALWINAMHLDPISISHPDVKKELANTFTQWIMEQEPDSDPDSDSDSYFSDSELSSVPNEDNAQIESEPELNERSIWDTTPLTILIQMYSRLSTDKPENTNAIASVLETEFEIEERKLNLKTQLVVILQDPPLPAVRTKPPGIT